jgi:hypothetical protein
MIDCAAGDRPSSVALPSHASLEPPASSAVPTKPNGVRLWAECDIPIDRLEGGGDIASAKRLILHIVGPLTDYPLPGCQTDVGNQGQLGFVLRGWNLSLAEVDRLAPETGFSFVIEAVPHTLPFDEKEVYPLIRQVLMLLSFIAGGQMGVGPIAGLDAAGRVVWTERGAPWVQLERFGWRWCPDRLVNTALPVLADGLRSHAADPGLEACVDRAMTLLRAADEPGVLDVKIPIACSGLELLSWSLLQHRQWLIPDALSKLSAGSCARLLLQSAGIPIDLPADFSGLSTRQGRLGQPSWAGPDLVFNVRNGVVHPPKSLSDPEWPSPDELFEAWRLATWYLELAIMQILGYNDQYMSRLKLTSGAGQTEPVPWQP